MFQFLIWGNKQITALQEMHAFEVAAEVIYKRQFWRGEGDFKESLVHAAENEKKHKDNLLKRLEKLGAKPHFLRYPLYLIGTLMGIVPSIFGRWAMCMSNIIFENQAIYDYNDFVRAGHLDEDSRKLVEQNIEDEKDHVRTWEGYLWGEK